VALSGDGFFVVSGAVDGVQGTFYTRAGQTTVRNDGALVNPQGLELQGYAANPDGTFSASVGSLRVPTSALPPRATGRLTVGANLDATATTPAAPWDVNNPGATSNFSTAMTVYDSLGNPHTVNVFFRRTGAGAWEYHAVAAGGEVTGGTAGRNVEVATGTLTFNTSGALQAQASTGGGTVNFVGARPGQTLAFNFGTPIATGGTGLDGITQFGSPSSIGSQSQDGYAAGDLSNVRIDGTGTVSGVFTNGQTIPLGKLAVARFRAQDGLGRAGHNLWVATRDSGEAALGTAGAGGRGSLVAGALEQSNVDITQQFVELIAHQRSFQANSKTITTADQMLQELMNLNR
jgi:flagellar hook protein FlgE